MSEATRVTDQLSRAFDGEAWHGESLFQILNGVTAAQAAARPITSAHTIWELVLHIAAWDNAALRRLGGATVELPDAEKFSARHRHNQCSVAKCIVECPPHARETHRNRSCSRGFAAQRYRPRQTGRTLHLLLHAPWRGAARALPRRPNRAAQKNVVGLNNRPGGFMRDLCAFLSSTATILSHILY